MRWVYRLVKEANKGLKDSEIGYLYGHTDNYENNRKKNKQIVIAGFDMDGTIITTKSGKRFPGDADDWRWIFPNVKDTLNQYHENGYEIIVVTNQAGIKSNENKMNEIKTKIQNIEKDLNESYPEISFQVYCAVHKDVHRKPFPTFFEKMDIDRKKSFYCGDGAGRPGDHTDADLKFSYNLRLQFRTPENLFLNDVCSRGILRYPIVPYSDEAIKVNKYRYVKNSADRPELIVMVGLPGSGKSYITKNIIEQSLINGIEFDIISMDAIKSKPQMLILIKTSACVNNNIIIDNTNLDVTTRSELIKIVKNINKNYYVRIIHVNTPPERCIHNNYYRYHKNHMINPKLIPEFVYKMMIKKFNAPVKSENYQIDIVDTINPGVPFDISYFYYFY